MSDVDPRFSAVLLAGGKSTRMGRDKAFLEIERVPLWRRQLSLLRELPAQEIFISGPRREEWENEDCIVIPDLAANAGPLAGLAAGLQSCATGLLLALALDLPQMTADYLRELVAESSEGIGCVPEFGGRFEPLAAVYPAASLPLARSSLASGDYSLQHFVARCFSEGLVRPKTIPPHERALFLNLNTPEDWRIRSHG